MDCGTSADAWLASSSFQVKISNPADMDLLMDEAAYAKHLESEADH
jgi:hypothetical protein